MNRYDSINPDIVKKVKQYAARLARKLGNKIEQEDLEQTLFSLLIPILEKYDTKRGNLLSFVNRVLFLLAKQIGRYYSHDKRKALLFEIQHSNAVTSVRQRNSADNKPTNIEDLDFEYAIEIMPPSLKAAMQQIKIYPIYVLKKRGLITGGDVRAIQKIMKHYRRQFQGVLNMTTQTKNISCIEILSPRELSKLSDEDMFYLSQKIAQTTTWIKKLKEKLEDAMCAKYKTNAEESLKETNKNFGTVNLAKGDYTVVVEIPKKVQWDQAGLARIYEKMDKEARAEIIKTTYAVDERVYAKLTENMKEALEPCRTTDLGKIKITINKNNEAA